MGNRSNPASFNFKNTENSYVISHLKVCLTVAKLSRVMRKPSFGICENKGADQLRGNFVFAA